MTCRLTIPQGILEGKKCTTYNGKEYYSFEGIPYAKPPIGKLRFRDPQKPDKWTGILDATKPGQKCAQLNPYGDTTFIGSEDCLYLNVYTPKMPAKDIKKLPVLFFVHGGRLLLGYGDYYKPDYLIQQDVVLVTINYRLHILGFLCLEIPEAPGNAGLKDSVMALKWVRDNISSFNGDAENVTVFGESAGAAMVSSYLTSTLADGLFTKIICQSGNLISDLYMDSIPPLDKVKYIAALFGQNIEDKRDLYDFLINVPIEELVNATMNAELSRPSHIIQAYFLPVIEKKFEGVEQFFFEQPIVSIKANRFKNIPILTTFSSHEGALFAQKDEKGDLVMIKELEKMMPSYLQMDNGVRSRKFASTLKEFYFKNKDIDKDTRKEYLDLVSDAFFARDVVMFAEYMAKKNEVYLCRFSYNGKMNTSVMKKLGFLGATHGDLIQYQFYRANKAKDCTMKDMEVVDTLVEAWCNFAKTGKPTWSNRNIEWVPYKADKRYCLEVGEDIRVVQNPIYNRYKLWIDLITDASKL